MVNGLVLAVDVAVVADVASAVAIVLGVVFAVIQLREAAQDRRDAAAFDVVRTVQTRGVRLAIKRVLELPIDADPAVVYGDPDLLEAALTCDSACEMWGSMVFEGVVDHQMLDRMVGGWVRALWSRLWRWVEAERTERATSNVGEWWQWLFELLNEDPDPSTEVGAHVAYRQKYR